MLSNSSDLLSFNRLFDQHLLQVWNLPEAANKETIDLSRYGAKNDSRIVFSPDGSLLAVASKNLLLWDFRNRKLIKSLQGDEEMFYSNISDVTFSADDNSIAYSFDYGGLRLATTTGDVILSLDEASGRAGLCLFEDGQLLTNGSQFWDLERSRLINTANSFHAERLFFTQGCDMFASMTEEGYFRVRRNNRGEILGERVGDFDLRTAGIYLIAPVAFSPDRKLVAVQEAVGRIRIFNLQTMETLTVLEGHRDTITGLLFTPDGKKLISSSLDGTIRLWGIHP
jgi:WD40 repeat protein